MSRPIQLIFRGLALVALVLVLIQPVLGSFSFFRPADSVSYDTIHLVVGAIIYNISIALALLALFMRVRRRWLFVGLCAAQVALLHGQLLLGLRSDPDVTLLAFHIPLGVLIVVISLVVVLLSFGAGERAEQV